MPTAWAPWPAKSAAFLSFTVGFSAVRFRKGGGVYHTSPRPATALEKAGPAEYTPAPFQATPPQPTRHESQESPQSRHPHRRRPRPVPLHRHRRPRRGVHEGRSEDPDHLLRLRLQGAPRRQVRQGHARGAEEHRRALHLRRLADRQLPREAHERQGLREARARQGGPGPAEGRGRAAREGRRRRPAHDRRRRYEHRGGGPRRLPRAEQLRAQGRRHAQDDRQRRLPDQAVPRRLDRGRAGRRRLHPRARLRRQGRGQAPPRRDGQTRQREHLRLRGRRRLDDHQGDGGARRGDRARRLRPPAARQDQPRRVVREAVRGAPGRREDDGPEVRLLQPRGGVQQGRREAHQGLRQGRGEGRARPEGQGRRRGPGRERGRQAPRVRVRAHQGRQALRHEPEVVQRPPEGHRPEEGQEGQPPPFR